MSAVRLRDGKGPPRESRRGSGSGRRLPSLEAPSETTRRARECVPRSARNGVRPPRGFRNLLPGKTDAAHVANSSLVSLRTKDTLAVPTSVWPTGRACYHSPSARLATCPSPSPEPPSPPVARARPPAPPPRRAFRARSRPARPRARFSARPICEDRTPPRCARRRTTRPPRPPPRPRSCPSPSSATTKRSRAHRSPPSSPVRPEHERTAATGVSVVIPRDDVAHTRETARRARANAKNALVQVFTTARC